MRKKTSTRKSLQLNRETVRRLSEHSLQDAMGGTNTNDPRDPSGGILCTQAGCGGIDP